MTVSQGALHTSLVKACWGAKEGTIRRRRWHAGGDRMGCGAAAVIHLHAVLGTIAPGGGGGLQGVGDFKGGCEATDTWLPI